MDYFDIQKLKTFFQALKGVNYKPNLFNIPLSIRNDSLNLLRKLPQFQGEEFKNDTTLINGVSAYLKDPTKRGRFLAEAGFTDIQQKEFSIILEKPTEGTEPEQTTEEDQSGGGETPAGQQTSGQTGPTAGGSGPGIPPIPRVPSMNRAPRVRMERMPEAAEEEGQKLYVANKSGQVVEERTVSPSGTTVRKPGEPSSISEGKSELVTANKSGVVNEGFKGEKIIAIANKSGQVIGEKLVKDLESKGQIGASKGIRAVGRGFGNILGGVGRGGLGLLGGAAGGGGRLIVRGGFGTADALGRASNRISRNNPLKRKGLPKKFWLLLLGMFGFMVFTSASARPINPNPGSGNVGIGPGGTTGELSCTTSMTAKDINDYFHLNGYDYFENTGDQFLTLASKYGINPAVIISIGRIESDLGRDYPVGSPGYNKFDAFGISPDGVNVLPFSSWMSSAEESFKAVASYKCAALECIAGRPQTYNSADPNWMNKLKSALAQIPHTTCGRVGGPVAGAPGIPSGWPATGLIFQVPYQPGTTHRNANAVDISNNAPNTPVYTTLDGKVSIPNNDPSGYGNYILITNENTGNKAIYAHLQSYSVVSGQMVQKGDQIGIMDSTGNSRGPHVHYELIGPLGSRTTPLDNYVPQSDLPLKAESTQVQAGSF